MILKLVPLKHTTKSGYTGYEKVLVEQDGWPCFMFSLEMLYEPYHKDENTRVTYYQEPRGKTRKLYDLLGKGVTVEVEVRFDIVDEERYSEE